MDPLLSSFLFGIFLIALLLFLYLYGGDTRFANVGTLQSAERLDYDLTTYLRREGKGTKSRKRYIFSEEPLVSMTYRYNGRFDSIVVKWVEGPILDAVIERKFPRSYLPDKPVIEDIFQASLYALALKEKGLSISSTIIVTIYCLQDEAERCLRKNSIQCIGCSKGAIFTERFNEKKSVKALEKLDEIWYRGRSPAPKPSERSCRICPYGKDGICNFSAV
ncbi:MAG: hypothetical protein ACFFED_09285 [Candidatus Thorarchaeota archaeon]